MAEIKFTKTEWRDQQTKLAELQRYLPTLQLKKAMLQAQAQEIRQEISNLEREKAILLKKSGSFEKLLEENLSVMPEDIAKVDILDKVYENVAGVELPTLKQLTFHPVNYNLFEAPIWLDQVVFLKEEEARLNIKFNIAIEKRDALEKELHEVSIRVNLFEKVMIPKARENIKKIAIFLQDGQLAAVARAKVAKSKIEAKKREFAS
jgi:V/A-type H+-transporting ATPase subunit D